MKRTHKNGWYVEWKSGGHVDFHYKNGVYVMGTDSLHITEQELIDFGFEPEMDAYEECTEEICKDSFMHHPTERDMKDSIKNILKKYFPRQ